MASTTRVFTALILIGALTSLPVSADQRSRRRGDSDQSGSSEQSRDRERAAPRSSPSERQSAPQAAQQVQPPPRNQDRNDSRNYDSRRYDNRAYNDRYERPYYAKGYGHPYVAPRVIRPRVVTVVPYRPYVYRPSFSVGVYYGTSGYYPYGYTPRGYYDPIPGRFYGGLRITGVPRNGQVFADGYYVGIVNDFDGVFQHLNLEAGGHTIDIDLPGYQRIQFNVMILAGQTTTFRTEMHRY